MKLEKKKYKYHPALVLNPGVCLNWFPVLLKLVIYCLFFFTINQPTKLITHTILLKMQFKNIVAAAIALGVASAANASNMSNKSNHSNVTTTKISTGAANSNALSAGVFGAAVAAGVAFLF